MCLKEMLAVHNNNLRISQPKTEDSLHIVGTRSSLTSNRSAHLLSESQSRSRTYHLSNLYAMYAMNVKSKSCILTPISRIKIDFPLQMILIYSTRSSSSDMVPPLAKKITKPPNDNKIGSFRQNPNLSCGYGIVNTSTISSFVFSQNRK